MPPVCRNQFITESLGFQGWKVEASWFDGNDLYLRLVPAEAGYSCCGKCGELVFIRKGYMAERKVRHQNSAGASGVGQAI
jgi:hypothetical protein